MPKRLDVSWDVPTTDIALSRFKRYLEGQGFRDATITNYISVCKIYLEWAGTDEPSISQAEAFRDSLLERKRARSTINNYSFTVKRYHEMLGEEFSFPFLKRNNQIPHFFDAEDVQRIFDVIDNLKHLALLQTAFYGCLRASEVCNLDDEDLDLSRLRLTIRVGKGGQDGIAYLSDEAAKTLKQYLAVRPPLDVDGRQPLFYSDYGQRMHRRDIYRIFIKYKRRAGIEKQGGVHVFTRHSSASIMIANGCDILTIQQLLRHKDPHTTFRYMHMCDETRRSNYNKFLRL
ncbi:MAG: tyrosine-type recombinase/integrase [Euryarchaeota archaeon]|nr:tyrosine-type recombinase/integrase [Euryarchaeota archaeon]